MQSIRIDSQIKAASTVNTENLRRTNIYNDANENISVIYPSPSLESYESRLFELLSNCSKVDWKLEWTMRPDYVSYYYYGSEVYWSLLLYVNNLSSIEDFIDLDYILIPTQSALNLILSTRYRSDDFYDVTPNNNVVNPNAKYYKKYPLDDSEKTKRNAEKSKADFVAQPAPPVITPPPSLISITDNYTLSATDIINEYVILRYIPANISTLSFKLKELIYIQKYAYDYVLIANEDSKHKKISWSAADCPYGSGMAAFIDEAGLEIEISYLYDANNQDNAIPTVIVDGGIFTKAVDTSGQTPQVIDGGGYTTVDLFW